MTVAELIELLETFDGNLPVEYGDDYEDGSIPVSEVIPGGTMGGMLSADRVIIR